MNTFGRLFRLTIFGESHGPGIGIVIDGCPAGMKLSAKDLEDDLARRKSGAKGTTPRKEPDIPEIKSGVFEGKTTGSPIMIYFENKDVKSEDYEPTKNIPRPGHADFVAAMKTEGFNDYRGGGHFSGRLTAGIVAAGAIAKKIVFPAKIETKLNEVGGSKDIEKALAEAINEGDSVGGVIECTVKHVPAGLGEPFFDSAESLLSHAIFSIPGVKGIGYGAGFNSAKMKGSECNDEIIDNLGKTRTNNAGGINGGITNGNDIVFRIAVKPTSSIKKPQKTVNLETGEEVEVATKGRHDACIALRMPVIVESAVAIVLADLMLMEQKRGRVMR